MGSSLEWGRRELKTIYTLLLYHSLLQLLISTALRHAFASIEYLQQTVQTSMRRAHVQARVYDLYFTPQEPVLRRSRRLSYLQSCSSPSAFIGVKSDPCPVIYSLTFAGIYSTCAVQQLPLYIRILLALPTYKKFQSIVMRAVSNQSALHDWNNIKSFSSHLFTLT